MKKILLLSVALCLAVNLSAKENAGKKSYNRTIKLSATGCTNGTAQVDLDYNNVRARVLQSGDMWWDLQVSHYEVPIGSGKTSMYAGSIWFGGVDAGGQVKVAAQTYRQFSGNDYWPGPLDTTTADITAGQCNFYNQFWKTTKQEVIDFVTNGTLTSAIVNWPGNGNVFYNEGHFLAPFFDVNGDGIYNTNDGDYPYYDLTGTSGNCNGVLHGDQNIWWVFNDAGNIKTETGSPPIGLEVQVQAFAFASPADAINNTTFYQYKIINRSSSTLNQTYFGQWADPDLGYYQDDYVGCDVNRGLGYCYNADANDDLPDGYGLKPPAIGIDFFEGPLADAGDGIDNDRDGTIDEPGEQIIMSKFVYYKNDNSALGNPDSLFDYYGYLKGIWKDSVPVTYGGDGYNPGSTNYCNFMFPGNTDTSYFSTLGAWTEATAFNAPGDRRFIQSAGEFTLLPGAVNYVTVGVIWARDTVTGASLDSLKSADDYVQQFYDSCFRITTSVNEVTEGKIRLSVYPNPFTQQTLIRFNNPDAEEYSITIFDSKGNVARKINQIRSDFFILKKGELTGGIYFLKINTENNSVSQKLIIQ